MSVTGAALACLPQPLMSACVISAGRLLRPQIGTCLRPQCERAADGPSPSLRELKAADSLTAVCRRRSVGSCCNQIIVGGAKGWLSPAVSWEYSYMGGLSAFHCRLFLLNFQQQMQSDGLPTTLAQMCLRAVLG